MKARQRKKWGWYECQHIRMCPPSAPPYIMCKQTGGECREEDCKKYFVSNFRKHCEYLGRKEAIRYINNNELNL